jgi:hypothetical protein
MANYRPICLLNTDHRLVAKILADRLGPLLEAAIGPEQSTFLLGRSITSNITFLQLGSGCAAALQQQRGGGAPGRPTGGRSVA